MSPVVALAFFGFPVAVLACYALLPSPRAMIAAALAGLLFLPNYTYVVGGVPPITKAGLASLSLLLATVLFDSQRLMALRPRLADLPALVWTLCPIASSVLNGLGIKDGIYGALVQSYAWGIPYLLGRVYLQRWEDLRDLAAGLFIGGLVYAPLAGVEMLISPQLHRIVYGFHPVTFFDPWRLGGYRPTVFMASGLQLGLFMTAASLAGFWLWRTRSIQKLFGLPMVWWVGGLLVTTVLCRSLGALTLLVVGVGLYFMGRSIRSAMPALVLVVAVGLYVGARATDPNGGVFLVELARKIDPVRADSLWFRMVNEDMLVEHALQRPLFGWGGWGRNRIYNEEGRDISVTDSLWILAVGMHGLVGLASVFGLMLTPLAMMVRRVRWAHWAGPTCGGAAALAIISAIYAVDCLFNDMQTPVYIIGAGGVVATLQAARRGPRPRAPGAASGLPARPPPPTAPPPRSSGNTSAAGA